MEVVSLDSGIDVKSNSLWHKLMLFRFIRGKHQTSSWWLNIILYKMYGGGVNVADAHFEEDFIKKVGMPKSTIFTYILNRRKYK